MNAAPQGVMTLAMPAPNVALATLRRGVKHVVVIFEVL